MVPSTWADAWVHAILSTIVILGSGKRHFLVNTEPSAFTITEGNSDPVLPPGIFLYAPPERRPLTSVNMISKSSSFYNQLSGTFAVQRNRELQPRSRMYRYRPLYFLLAFLTISHATVVMDGKQSTISLPIFKEYQYAKPCNTCDEGMSYSKPAAICKKPSNRCNASLRSQKQSQLVDRSFAKVDPLAGHIATYMLFVCLRVSIKGGRLKSEPSRCLRKARSSSG